MPIAPLPLPEGAPITLGAFRLTRFLGRGGMGNVYLAERVEAFSQRVAIKVLHPVESAPPSTLATTHEEKVLVSLDHAGIVRLLDRGVADSGLLYLVMEYVEGIPLDAYCDAHRLSVPDRLRLLMQVMDAVSYAHRRFVVHSDLKPGNILVNEDGHAKLLDFGIATLLKEWTEQSEQHHQHEQHGQHEQSSLAARPSPYFSPSFASPEQRDGRRITVATDIYSIGVLARFLLTGVPPMPHAAQPIGRSTTRMLRDLDRAALQQTASLRSTTPTALLAALEGDLQAILTRATCALAEDRYPSVDALQADLALWLAGRPITARRTSSLDRSRKWVLRNKLATAISGVVAASILLSIFAVVEQSAQAARQRRIAEKQLHELVRLTGVLEGELYQSVEPLPHAEQAKHTLLAGATQTLDTLAADDKRDSLLTVELAQQYSRLARLRLAEGRRLDPSSRLEAGRELDKGMALLQTLPSAERSSSTVSSEMASMAAMRRGAAN